MITYRTTGRWPPSPPLLENPTTRATRTHQKNAFRKRFTQKADPVGEIEGGGGADTDSLAQKSQVDGVKSRRTGSFVQRIDRVVRILLSRDTLFTRSVATRSRVASLRARGGSACAHYASAFVRVHDALSLLLIVRDTRRLCTCDAPEPAFATRL